MPENNPNPTPRPVSPGVPPVYTFRGNEYAKLRTLERTLAAIETRDTKNSPPEGETTFRKYPFFDPADTELMAAIQLFKDRIAFLKAMGRG